MLFQNNLTKPGSITSGILYTFALLCPEPHQIIFAGLSNQCITVMHLTEALELNSAGTASQYIATPRSELNFHSHVIGPSALPCSGWLFVYRLTSRHVECTLGISKTPTPDRESGNFAGP